MILSGWGNDTLEKSVVEKMTYISDGLKVTRLYRLSER